MYSSSLTTKSQGEGGQYTYEEEEPKLQWGFLSGVSEELHRGND